MAACEGALLLVDASQGVEAQTLANTWLALRSKFRNNSCFKQGGFTCIRTRKYKNQINDLIGLDTNNVFNVSGKTGEGVKDY